MKFKTGNATLCPSPKITLNENYISYVISENGFAFCEVPVYIGFQKSYFNDPLIHVMVPFRIAIFMLNTMNFILHYLH